MANLLIDILSRVKAIPQTLIPTQSKTKGLISPLASDIVNTADTYKAYWGPPPEPTVNPRNEIAQRMRQPQLVPQSQPQVLGAFNFEPYRESGDQLLPQPPTSIAQRIKQVFGDEADKAAVVAASENGMFNPNAYNFNTDKTGDYGIFQINSRTLVDFLRRYPDEMDQIGIRSVDDLQDIDKNIQMAKLIRDVQGWGAWYGPKNKGFNVSK